MAGSFIRPHGRVYQFQRRVPRDVREVIGFDFWRARLDTMDRRQAEMLGRQHAVRTDQEIEEARQRASLTPEQAAVLARAGGMSGLTAQTDTMRASRPYLTFAADTLADLHRQPADDVDPDRLEADLEETTAALTVQDRQMARNIAILEKRDGAKVATPKPAPLTTFATNPAREYAVRKFVELFGPLPLSKITRRHAPEFLAQIARLPRTPKARIRNSSIHEAIRIADREGLDRIDHATVRRHFFSISACLNDAMNDGLIEFNPFAGYRLKRDAGNGVPKHADTKAQQRKGFTVAEMRVLDTASAKLPTDDRWIFFLASYQGARREECAQLLASDIQQSDGVWCMQITDAGPDQRVKNRQSVRLIPLHADLLARGFLDHIRVADGRLFASLKRDKRGRYSDVIGQRFSDLCASAGMKGKSFHSLRHAWKTAARNANVPEEVAEAIAGRTVGSAIASRYGDLADPSVLAPWLDKVKPFGS